MLVQRSTLQLLRFHFSFFLLPVFLFACAVIPALHYGRCILVFFILHLLVYPASNGYNSYMDRDTTPIGGLKEPMQPTEELFRVTLLMDILAVLLSLLISIYFAAGILVYILVSRAYSYRGIRLKKYPVIGYLTVMIFQGGFTFMICYHGCSKDLATNIPMLPAIISSLLIGGFYPLTQIYQHEDDLKDGVRTISYMLGYKGSFIFCGILYTLAVSMLYVYFSTTGQTEKFFVFILLMSPVLFFFLKWSYAVWHDISAANFNNTMKMNVIASSCTNLAFIALLIWRFIE
ncbi:MAG TPA: UbiA family prenyltransferase [Chitinophagaceae bacterium]|nr:UbiA family prenyltransferase [Chitinophagaceae bacterium]